MNRHQIMYLLLERGYTQSRIAREIGVTPQAVSSIVRGTATSERIKKRIAEILSRPMEEIWSFKAA